MLLNLHQPLLRKRTEGVDLIKKDLILLYVVNKRVRNVPEKLHSMDLNFARK